MEFKEADLIMVIGRRSLFHKLIGWFSRTCGEPLTKAKHVAGFLSPGVIIEALWTVKTSTAVDWLGEHKDFEVWRNHKLSLKHRERISNRVRGYRYHFYGFWRLFLHAGDLLVEKVIGKHFYFFRKMIKLNDYPICSWLWAMPYYEVAHIQFGVPYNYASPDDMRDFISQNENWELVYKVVHGIEVINRLR